jgi:hypothetical protein
VQVVQRLHLVAEELDADGQFLVRRDDLHGVAADPERAAAERHVVTGVLGVDQGTQQRVAVDLLSHLQRDRAVQVLLRAAQTVDARHGRDHHHVAPGQQAPRRRVA